MHWQRCRATVLSSDRVIAVPGCGLGFVETDLAVQRLGNLGAAADQEANYGDRKQKPIGSDIAK